MVGLLPEAHRGLLSAQGRTILSREQPTGTDTGGGPIRGPGSTGRVLVSPGLEPVASRPRRQAGTLLGVVCASVSTACSTASSPTSPTRVTWWRESSAVVTCTVPSTSSETVPTASVRLVCLPTRKMGDTGLELASGAQVGPDSPVLLGLGALRSAQLRSNCYQNCYQGQGQAATVE
jgi:hypothetical protein